MEFLMLVAFPLFLVALAIYDARFSRSGRSFHKLAKSPSGVSYCSKVKKVEQKVASSDATQPIDGECLALASALDAHGYGDYEVQFKTLIDEKGYVYGPGRVVTSESCGNNCSYRGFVRVISESDYCIKADIYSPELNCAFFSSLHYDVYFGRCDPRYGDPRDRFDTFCKVLKLHRGMRAAVLPRWYERDESLEVYALRLEKLVKELDGSAA